MKVVAKGQLPAYNIGRTARTEDAENKQEPLPSFESVLRAVFSEFDLKTLGTKKAEREKQRPYSAFAEAPRRGHRPSSATFIPMGHVRAPWPSDRCFPPSSSLQESAMMLNAEHSLRRVRPLSAGPTRPISAPVARQETIKAIEAVLQKTGWPGQESDDEVPVDDGDEEIDFSVPAMAPRGDRVASAARRRSSGAWVPPWNREAPASELLGNAESRRASISSEVEQGRRRMSVGSEDGPPRRRSVASEGRQTSAASLRIPTSVPWVSSSLPAFARPGSSCSSPSLLPTPAAPFSRQVSASSASSAPFSRQVSSSSSAEPHPRRFSDVTGYAKYQEALEGRFDGADAMTKCPTLKIPDRSPPFRPHIQRPRSTSDPDLRRRRKERGPLHGLPLVGVMNPAIRRSIDIRNRAIKDAQERVERAALAASASDAEEKADKLDLLPWEPSQVRNAFQAFDHHQEGELHIDDLCSALQRLGLHDAEEVTVKRLARSLTRFATLSWDEFTCVLRAYREEEVRRLEVAFQSADADGSGFLDIEEICVLLKQLGYPALRQTAMDLLRHVDTDGDGKLQFPQFERMLHHVRATEGFGGRDIRELQDLFHRTAGSTNEDSEIPADEVWKILLYRGYNADLAEVTSLMGLVKPKGGSIGFWDLLKVASACRDSERVEMVGLVKQYSQPGEEAIKRDQIGTALQELGFLLSEEVTEECLKVIEPFEQEGRLNVDELLCLVQECRRREGFSLAQVAELREAFVQSQPSVVGELDELKVSQVLRYLGHPTTLQHHALAIRDVDLDNNGALCFPEFLKMMRHLHQKSSERRMSIFQAHCLPDSRQMPTRHMGFALGIVRGCPLPPESLAALRAVVPANESEVLSYRTFEKVCASLWRMDVEEARSNSGFSPVQVQKLKVLFNTFDKEGCGHLGRAEFRELLTEALSGSNLAQAQHEETKKLLNKLDSRQTGDFYFKDLLLVLRTSEDFLEKQDKLEEAQVVQELEMSTNEVHGFREVFVTAAGLDGFIRLETILSLFSFAEFSNIQQRQMKELVAKLDTHYDGLGLRFPAFLRLMKQLSTQKALGVPQAAMRLQRQQALTERWATQQGTAWAPEKRIAQCRMALLRAATKETPSHHGRSSERPLTG